MFISSVCHIHVCPCICIHACMCPRICLFMHMCIQSCMFVPKNICVYACVSSHDVYPCMIMSICVLCFHARMPMCTYIVYIYMCPSWCMQVCMYQYISVHVCVYPCMCFQECLSMHLSLCLCTHLYRIVYVSTRVGRASFHTCISIHVFV